MASALIPPYTLICESDFEVMGLQQGEAIITPIRTICTLITISITWGWFQPHKVRRLHLFFSLWVSGLVFELCSMAEVTMISVCWTRGNIGGLIKALKFLQLAASHLMAFINLAICVNLALIVVAHRTMSRVNNVSSPPRILLFSAISVGVAAAPVPFWAEILVFGTEFFVVVKSERAEIFLSISVFIVELSVGICMLLIVSWLLVFRARDFGRCWARHARIRYYLGLTLLATVVNIALGVCGILHAANVDPSSNHMIWDWSTSTIRFVHVALDTIVLYGVLRERFPAGGGGGSASGSGRSNPSSSASRAPTVFLPSLRQQFSLRRTSRRGRKTSSVPVAPLLTSEG